MPVPHLIILNCWLVLILYWFISWFAVKATAERKSFASALPYRIPLVIGAYVVIKIHGFYPWNLRLTPHAPTPWIGAAVCVVGLAIAIWSRWTLGGNWSGSVRFKQGHELVKTGPYRFARHPIYTGILLMCLAPPIEFGRLHHWLGTLIIAIGLWIKLKQEETVMLRHFPEYTDYQKRVKSLVPFVI